MTVHRMRGRRGPHRRQGGYPVAAPRGSLEDVNASSRIQASETVVSSRDVLVRHDWTFGGLMRICRSAARRTSAMDDDFAEKVDIALLACIEMLWAADESPDRWDLLDHASDAVRRHVRQDMSVHGKTKWNTEAPRHRTYWLDHHRAAEPATDRLVERMALTQVYLAMDERDQELLWTRAMHVMAMDAAAALGKSRSLFCREYRAARRRALRLWFDEETPVSLVGKRDRRINQTGLARRIAERQRVTRGAGKR